MVYDIKWEQFGNLIKVFSTKLLMKVLEAAEKRRRQMDNLKDKHIWTVFFTYAVMSYVLSLRGNEGFMLDIEGTI